MSRDGDGFGETKWSGLAQRPGNTVTGFQVASTPSRFNFKVARRTPKFRFDKALPILRSRFQETAFDAGHQLFQVGLGDLVINASAFAFAVEKTTALE